MALHAGARALLQSRLGRKLIGHSGLGGVRFSQIQHVEHRFEGKKRETTNSLGLIGSKIELAQRLLLIERNLADLQDLKLFFEGRILEFLDVLFQALQPLLDHGEVGEDQLQFDVFDVALGVNGGFFHRHRIVCKGADHVDERVELAQSLRLHARARHFDDAAGRVHVFDGGVGVLHRLEHGNQAVEALIAAP